VSAALDFGALHDDLLAVTAEVRAMVAPLDDGGWRTPTPAPGWTITDQVSHLAHFDDMTVLAVTDPDRFRIEREPLLADIDGLTENVAAAHRGDRGEALLAWWDRARAGLVATTRSLDPRQRVPWYGPDMSVASAVTARVMETWAHGQDIADALGVERLAGPAVRHVADLGVRTFGNSFAAHGLPVPDVACRVELRAPDGGQWKWGPDDATDVVQGSAEAFCLVVTQRRHRSDVDLITTGPVAARWMEVAQAYAGPPGAKREQASRAR
jgi:uncharacterized protein (TIGR03084 family)